MGLLPNFQFHLGCKLLSVDINSKVVLEMFGSGQPRHMNQRTLLYLNECDVGLSGSAKALLQEIKRSEEYYILQMACSVSFM